MEEDSFCGKTLTGYIKQEAFASGFCACGIATVSKLHSVEPFLKKWLEQGNNGSMGYMAKDIEKRLDPRKLIPGSKSIIVVALNYFPANMQNPESSFLISKYAYGNDYHFIIKEKLNAVASKIKKLVPDFEYRIFTDSAPVMEREWAVRAGLGWIGKNGCLLLPQKGSFFFLGEIVCNLELVPDQPFSKNLCGNCSKCIDACPTGAIIEPGVLDARRCISYLTIESKSETPRQFRDKNHQWIFGCDICQDVCPHNRFSTPTKEAEFNAKGPVRDFEKSQWLNLDEKTFKQFFRKSKSPLIRVKFEKLKDNISAVNQCWGRGNSSGNSHRGLS